MATKPPVTDPAHFLGKCPTCGRKFLASEVGKRGAPRVYDTLECAAAARAWVAFHAAFAAILPRLTIRRLFDWRGTLFAMASERAWNAGVPAKMSRADAEARETDAEREAIALAIAAERVKFGDRAAVRAAGLAERASAAERAAGRKANPRGRNPRKSSATKRKAKRLLSRRK